VKAQRFFGRWKKGIGRDQNLSRETSNHPGPSRGGNAALGLPAAAPAPAFGGVKTLVRPGGDGGDGAEEEGCGAEVPLAKGGFVPLRR